MTATAELNKASYAIDTLTISHILNCQLERIDAHGKSVQLNGTNDAGKTSRTWAVWLALNGLDAKRFPEPVTHGADKGQVDLLLKDHSAKKLPDLHIKRIVKQKKDSSAYTTELSVKFADESKKREEPQTLLKSLMGRLCLDPVAFPYMRPQDQIDCLLSRAGVPVPAEAVAKLCGKTHAPLPTESADAYLMRLSADETGLYYLSRREANKVQREKMDALADQERQLSSIGGRPGDRELETSVAESAEKISELQAAQEERRAAHNHAALLANDVAEKEKRLRELSAEMDSLDAEQKRLEAQLEAVKAKRIETEKSRARGQVITDNKREVAASAKAAADAIPDPSPQINILNIGLHSIEEKNKKLRGRVYAAKEVERLRVEYNAAEAEHKRHDDIVAGLRDMRLHLLDGHDIGIPGLGIVDGEIRVGKTLFSQLGKGTQMDYSCIIACDPSAAIKICRVDDMERLSQNNAAKVISKVESLGFQCLCARCTEGPLEIRILEASNVSA